MQYFEKWNVLFCVSNYTGIFPFLPSTIFQVFLCCFGNPNNSGSSKWIGAASSSTFPLWTIS